MQEERPAFYVHLVLLHATLVLRIASDLVPWLPARQWGGLGNAVALVLFFASTAYGALRPLPAPAPTRPAAEAKTGPSGSRSTH